MKCFIKFQSGSVSIIVALVFPIIVAFLAFSVDIGNAYYVKTKIQLAGDAAALGAALSLSNQSAATSAALQIVAENTPAYFGNLSTSADVVVGAWNSTNKTFIATTNSPNAVQVKTHRTTAYGNPVSTFFGRFVGASMIDINSTSVAVYYNGVCVLVLDPSSQSVSLKGSSAVSMNCPLQVNSSNSVAIKAGGSSSVSASKVCIMGGYSGNVSPTPITGCATALDPYANTPEPTKPSCSYTQASYLSKSTCAYVGGNISASGTIPAGLYYLSGANLNIGSNASVSGSGVTFFLDATSTLSLGGNSAAINLTAPSSGSLAGILIFQSRSAPLANSSISLLGSSSLSILGLLYAPRANLTLGGSSGFSGSTGKVVVDEITNGGSSNFTMAVPYAGEASLRTMRAHASLVH